MSTTRSYRLETAIRRLYDLHLGPGEYDRLSVKIKFLDFPDILVRSDAAGVVRAGGGVAFNVCHRAEFQMTDDQRITGFPARCFCEIVREGARPDAADLQQDLRWSCPCPLQQSDSESRAYNSFPIIDHRTGETVGYAEMACRVVPDVSTAAPWSQPASAVTAALAVPPPLPLPNTPGASAAPATDGAIVNHQGRPYIVRVVVGNKERRTSGDGMPYGGRATSGRRYGSGVAATYTRPTTTMPAEEETLLYVLEYDVACQLQSFTECLATTLKREHSSLNAVAKSKRCAALATDIDTDVKRVFKMSNIILQIANQLIDGSDVPERTGTTRMGKETGLMKHNPINKLPSPKDGSVYHYLLYDVLFQLQCLGANLSYLIALYPAALDTPLKKLPPQHVAFCRELESSVQSLVRNVNVLTQSAIDGRYRKDGAPTAASPDNGAATKPRRAKSSGATTKKRTRHDEKEKKSARKAPSDAPSSRSSSSSSSVSTRSSASSFSSSFSSSASSRSSSVGSSSSTNSAFLKVTKPIQAATPLTTLSIAPPAVPVPMQNTLTGTSPPLIDLHTHHRTPPSPSAGAQVTTLPTSATPPPPMPVLSGGAAPVLSAGAPPQPYQPQLQTSYQPGNSFGSPPGASSFGDQLEAFRFGGGGSGNSTAIGNSRSTSLGGGLTTGGVGQPLNFNASGSLGGAPSLAMPAGAPAPPPRLSIPTPQAPVSVLPTPLAQPSVPSLPVPMPPQLAR